MIMTTKLHDITSYSLLEVSGN